MQLCSVETREFVGGWGEGGMVKSWMCKEGSLAQQRLISRAGVPALAHITKCFSPTLDHSHLWPFKSPFYTSVLSLFKLLSPVIAK